MKVKFFFIKSSFLLIVFFALSCQNLSISNKYKTGNEKICIHLNIETNIDRLFVKQFKENPNISDIDDCDYFLLATITKIPRAITSSAGIQVINNVNLYAHYNLYKFDRTKLNEVKNILENPSIYEHINYTSKKKPAILKSSSVMNDIREQAGENQNVMNIYSRTNRKINKLLTKISAGYSNKNINYVINYSLLTNLQQSRDDAEEQIIKTLAEQIYNNVLLDIEDFNFSEYSRKCQKYYNKCINPFFDENEKTTECNAMAITFEEKKKLETSCKTEFNKFEKEKIEQQQQEREYRLKLIRAKMQDKIKETKQDKGTMK